ncbi:hypothetical protein D0X99_11575 [Algoriphagus lacus]|uniref:Uncharacterized protein n=1 Tax=Algoriphagus lacus TaxID=2056311 RepID=A0A418PR71_9BACT|nr:hypothetical protein [Algoriphagus lacus]RIW15081.1 hypothetical protein D0X99_11575 [Algoriphagus lacus]
MIKNAFLSFFLLFLATFAFSQSPLKYELSLTKRPSAIQEEISYMLQRGEDGGILIIKEKIFSAKGSAADSLFLTSVLEKPSDEKRILLREFVESKTTYVSDSLVITDLKVLEEIDLMVSKWNNLVEQSHLKNPNRFVLDGTTFSLSLLNENQELSSFSIHSPDDQTHPEITRLLRSLELLSKEF